MEEINLKEQLAEQAKKSEKREVSKVMTIPDMIKAMEPEIKKALPSVITPERFTRIALSATSNNPELTQCTPISFISALLNAAQLGLEPNTPLGQAYLIPYKNKGKLECQFQIGYKGLIDLAYRNGDMQTIQAHTVYSNDEFDFSYGLNGTLVHKPAKENRGEPVYFYGFFKTTNGGYSQSNRQFLLFRQHSFLKCCPLLRHDKCYLCSCSLVFSLQKYEYPISIRT